MRPDVEQLYRACSLAGRMSLQMGYDADPSKDS